jgi:hypothetical protein
MVTHLEVAGKVYYYEVLSHGRLFLLQSSLLPRPSISRNHLLLNP